VQGHKWSGSTAGLLRYCDIAVGERGTTECGEVDADHLVFVRAKHLRNAPGSCEFCVVTLPVIHAQRMAGEAMPRAMASTVAESIPPITARLHFSSSMSRCVSPQQFVQLHQHPDRQAVAQYPPGQLRGIQRAVSRREDHCAFFGKMMLPKDCQAHR